MGLPHYEPLAEKNKTTGIKACTPLIHSSKMDTNLLVHVITTRWKST